MLKNIPEIEQKIILLNNIAKMLSKESIDKALRDHHSWRKPRPCGFTIHTGIGCSLGCRYCYIYDMGFSQTIEKYPLSGYELVYALLKNPYFIPGKYGSLIAIGSVTEPFHHKTVDTTLEYMQFITKYLGNPIQFSTKMYINEEIVKQLGSINTNLSPLITIITLKNHNKLEPNAPPPNLRFKTIENLSKHGFKPFLFLRPLIPGIPLEEYYEIIDRSIEHGAVGVVAGSLRITERILDKLRVCGVDVNEVIERAPRLPRGGEQVSIDMSDVKDMVARYAISKGVLFFPEACMANLYTHNMFCWKMLRYVNLPDKPLLTKPGKSELIDLADKLGISIDRVEIGEHDIDLWISRREDKAVLLAEIIHSRYRMCVRIRKTR